MRIWLTIVSTLAVIVPMPRIVCAEQVLAATFDGVVNPLGGWYTGFDQTSSIEQGAQVQISGTGNFLLTTARLPVGALNGAGDPTMFAMFFRRDAGNTPGDVLSSFVFDSRVLGGGHFAPLNYNFVPPIPVTGGQFYWLTLQAIRAPLTPAEPPIGIGWGGVDFINGQYLEGWTANRQGSSPTELPVENWSVRFGRTFAYQLLGVPEPSTLMLLGIGCAAIRWRFRCS